MVLLVSLFTIPGCGSGGDTIINAADDPPDGAPTNLALSVLGPKRLQLAWDYVANVDHFVISEDRSATSNYVDVAGATNIKWLSHPFDVPVHRQPWGTSQFTVSSCNRGGTSRLTSNPITLPGSLNLAAIGYFKASNTNAEDWFGHTVAISGDGNTIAVGARGEDSVATGINGNDADNSATFAGAVYVFRNTASGWAQEAYVKASNNELGDLFGYSVALSEDGNTLAVGARSERSNATGVNGDQTDNSLHNAGAAYVFTRSGSTWTQEAYIKASNTNSLDRFGAYLTLSKDGNTLAVSAYHETSAATGINGDQSNDTLGQAGAVYVYKKTASVWAFEAYIKASNTESGDEFGTAMALSDDGDTLAVGTIMEASNARGINGNDADNSVMMAGAVYVYRRTGTTWVQEAYVKASNTEWLLGFGDAFGCSVSLSADGNTMAVGAYAEISSATGMNGDETDSSLPDPGAVYIFTRSGTTWTQETFMKASNTNSYARFGFSVSLGADGNSLAVGASGERSSATGMNGNQANVSAAGAGAAYFFTRTGSTWTQESYIKATNTEFSDNFGTSIALSSDGNALAVGAYGEDGSSTGVNGPNNNGANDEAGAVYVY